MSTPPPGPPPQGPAPQWQSPQWSARPWPPPPAAAKQRWTRKIVIIGLAIALVLLVAVSVVGIYVKAKFGNFSRQTTAKSTADFNIVCKDGSVRNASTAAKPYKILAFYQDDQPTSNFDDHEPTGWSGLLPKTDADYSVDSGNLASVNVVACLTRKPETEVKTKTCDFESGDQPVTLEVYTVRYSVSLYDAKTGKKIETLGTVEGPAPECPFLTWIDPKHPRIYGPPERAAVQVMLTAFAAK